MKQKKLDTTYLRSVPGLAEISASDLARLASLSAECTVNSGQVLTQEGLPGREAFLVLEGEADVTVRGVVVGRAVAGDVIGELALIDQSPRFATVTAVTPMRLLAITPSEFNGLKESPDLFFRLVTQQLARRLRDVQRSRP